MRKVLVGIAFAAAALTALAATGASAKAAPAKAIGCTNGVFDRINGRNVCIHLGGKCIAAHNAKYRANFFTCVKGRLREYSPAPHPTSPPPPLPPTPVAIPGHYEGRTSQNELIRLDVQPGGRGVTGFYIHAINESCSPSGGLTREFSWGWVPDSITVDGMLTSKLGYFRPTLPFTVVGGFTLHAGFTGIVVTGTFTDETKPVSKDGTPLSCSSGLVSFTATRQS
jgi:hypothetical protein